MRFSPPPLLAGIAVLALGLFATGCNHSARRTSNPTFGNRVAIALTVNGTEQPSPQQWAALFAALQPQLAAYGLVLVDDLAQADRILRIDFTPSITDPTTSGRATMLGWRANPMYGYSYANSSSPSFQSASYTSGMSGYTSGMSAYNSSTYGYDRYPNGGYSPGYSGGSSGGSTTVATTTPVKPNHPGYRHDDRPPGQPNPPEHRHDDRPPGTSPPASGDHGRYAGGDRPPPPNRDSHPHPAPPAPPPTYASSSGQSSSYSAPSYSAPSYSSSSAGSSGAYSSSSSSGSVSSSSAAASSGSSSSGSSGSRDSSTQRQQN